LHAASELATTLYDWVAIGKLAHQAGLQEFATKVYDQAAASCQHAAQFRQLHALLRNSRLSPARISHYYALGAKAVTTSRERLCWAEGIIDIVNDRQWAQKAYQQLAPELTTEPVVQLFHNSRKYKLQNQLNASSLR